MSPRTRVTDELRDELERGRVGLLVDKNNARLLDVLARRFPRLTCAYVLNWIPEQLEDIFIVLVNGAEVAEVEIGRASGQGELDQVAVASVEEYLRRHPKMSKVQRRKLKAAMVLSRERGQ